MKSKFSAVLITAILFSLSVFSDSLFSDINSDDWYVSEVESAYSAGLMEGTGNGLFSPEKAVTVAEAVTIAARASASYNNEEIRDAAQGEKWYESYFDYAVNNGFATASLEAKAEKDALRHEVATIFASALPEEYYPAKNSYTAIPDIYYTDSFKDDVLFLYNAGVLAGNDEFGSFAPQKNITRAELAAVVNRVAFPEKRIVSDIQNRDAYYIIDAPNMASGRNGLANGWLYDNKTMLFNTSGRDSAHLADESSEKYTALYRDFDEESDGLLTLEVFCEFTAVTDGVYIGFADKNGDIPFRLTTKNGYIALCGKTDAVSNIKVGNVLPTSLVVVMNIDLDNDTVTAVVNNVKVGTVSIKKDASLCRLIIGTTVEEKGKVTAEQVRLTKNYIMSEHFSATSAMAGQTPVTVNTSGSVTIAKTSGCSGKDIYSAKITGTGSVHKAFEKISHKGVFESYILLPQKTDGAYFALYEGAREVIRIETKNGAWYSGSTKLRDYTGNIWQTVRIDTDLRSGKAIMKICGKAVAELPVSASCIDGIKAGFAPSSGSSIMYIDDIIAYNMLDHSDYPEYPRVAPSTDYNIGLHVCNLWRDSHSGEGWDSSAPFDELEPLLGFYEEGTPELADWEIKMMVEHGIDFQHICWYCPSNDINVPVKSEKVSHAALHDGFMQARYSDLMQFCLMWENNGQNVSSLEQFKTYLWSYWKEYYFSDPRHARLDNRAVLTVWSFTKFKDAFGGVDGAKKAIEFMREDIKTLGYDGLILLFADGHQMTKSFFDSVLEIGADATYPYHFNREGRFASHQIYRVSTQISFNSIHTIPAVSIGFNDIGRNEKRTAVITPEEHKEVCVYLRDEALPARNSGNWKDNTFFVSTWNEYSEGTYAMPCNIYGYAYLENIREVFTDDTSDHKDVDVTPTESQKHRVTHMYPDNHQPIRWYKFEQSDIETKAVDVKSLEADTIWDFSTSAARDVWRAGHGLTTYEETSTSLKGSAEGASDYSVITKAGLGIAIDEIPYIHIKMKVEGIGSKFEIFFATEDNHTMGATMYTSGTIQNEGEFVDYYVDMTEISTWTGNLYQLRIDPMVGYGSFEIECVELMKYADPENETTKWVFAKEKAANFWKSGTNLTSFAVSDGKIKGSTGGNGTVVSGTGIGTKLDNYPYVRIRMKNTGEGDKFAILFATTSSTGFDSNKRVEGRIKNKGEFADYYIRMTGNKYWTGALYQLGIEPMNGAGSFEIESVELMNEYTMPIPEHSWIFSDSTALDKWREGHGMKSYSEGDGVIKGSSDGVDYAVVFENQSGINIDNTPYLHISLKTEGTGPYFEVFFRTTNSKDESKNRVYATLRNKGEFTDYYVDMTQDEDWKGNLTYLRIDPMSGPGSFEIESISLFGIEKSNCIYSTNTRNVGLNFAPVLLTDGNYEITADPRKGFYSSLQLFHTWNRYTGVLMLESFDKQIYFTVGSNTATVNGKKVDLGFTFKLRDGLPLFRLNEFMSLFGYKVHTNGYNIDIQTVSDSEYTAIMSRLPNQWDFEYGSDTEGFSGQNASLTVSDGIAQLTATNSDPAYISPSLSIRADRYSKLVIGIVGDTSLYKNKTGQMFFTTVNSTSMSEDKSIKIVYDVSKMKDGEIYEVVFNLDDCDKWGGNVNKLRFDPINGYGTIKVDYIRFLE